MTGHVCIHCHEEPREAGLVCGGCWDEMTARAMRASSRRQRSVCLNRGRPTRAVKVQRVIDRYGDDLCALDPPRGNESRGMSL